MKSLGRIVWTCWMACSLLCCWIPATTASLLLAMLLESLPSTSAGVLMVIFPSFSSPVFAAITPFGFVLNMYVMIINVIFCSKNPGSIWISSELKGLNDDCEHFESFPPGHLYSSKTGGLKRWYNPPWFSETIPSMPYDPLVLRSAFESVNSSLASSYELEFILISY